MLTCFSTLACPDFSWQDIYSMAKDFNFNGIEIRGLGQDIFSVKAPPFTEANLPKTVAKLKELKLAIPCLSSGEPVLTLLPRIRQSLRSGHISSSQISSELLISVFLATVIRHLRKRSTMKLLSQS